MPEESSLYINTLLCRIKALEQDLQAFRNGEKYKKLRSDYEMILRAKDRKIREMEIELANEEIYHKSQRDQWFSDNERWLNEYQRKLKKYITENERLKDLRVKDNIEWNAKFTEMSERYTKELNERDRQIKELLVELGHEKALRNHDGNNTGLPTSQTPINKKKRIPNTREKTGRKKGGQYGHKKYVLETPTEAELTDIIEHKLEEDDICPGCECRSYKYTGNYEDKYEIGYEVVTKKIKHRYYECQCRSCGALFHTKYDPNLRGDCQYDANVQATILSLINTTNAAINKIPLFIKGFTGDEVNPCEGYVAKVQKRAAQGLVPFREELSRFLLTRDLIYWDDTVIMIMTERGCLRYYGDEAIALYFAHKNKDMAGLDKDGLLNLLKKDTKVMHDHNKVNYNPKYVFTNIECIIHLMRDLQKNADDTQHTEMLELKKLITDLISDKKKLEKEGRRRFSTQRINKTKEEIDEILDRAEKTNKEYHNRFFKKPDATLIQRIRKHYDNYFMWMKDFELPTTNNLAERSLRPVKSKMKISGQFESADRADDYAVIRTYIETCRRNGINEIEALIRACNGNPYTVKEIFG